MIASLLANFCSCVGLYHRVILEKRLRSSSGRRLENVALGAMKIAAACRLSVAHTFYGLRQLNLFGDFPEVPPHQYWEITIVRAVLSLREISRGRLRNCTSR